MVAPIPKGLPLPLPVPPELLVVMHVVFFGIHILFVNLMLGGALLTFFYEIRGRFRSDYDELAHEIAKTITVNKSLAVVMGVGPLLIINLLYTTPFYSATLFIGNVWILIVPLVIIAFLIIYLHKYTWHYMQGPYRKGLHILMIGVASAILLCIPLIFLTVINLMLFPDRWLEVHSFSEALLLPNVLPRYLHFLLASFSVISLFLIKWTSRPAFPAERLFTSLTRAELRQQFYALTLGTTILQFLAGPLVLITLPAAGMNVRTLLAVACGVTFAIPAVRWMWLELDRGGEGAGKRYWHIVGAISMTVMFMVIGRHLYRDEAVADFQQAVAAKTRAYELRRDDAQKGVFPDEVVPAPTVANGDKKPSDGLIASPIPLANDNPKRKDPRFIAGEKIYGNSCNACHNPLIHIGPPLREIFGLYKDKPELIAAWAHSPGPKKRPTSPIPMPPQPGSMADLTAAGYYMLVIGEEDAAKDKKP